MCLVRFKFLLLDTILKKKFLYQNSKVAVKIEGYFILLYSKPYKISFTKSNFQNCCEN